MTDVSSFIRELKTKLDLREVYFRAIVFQLIKGGQSNILFSPELFDSHISSFEIRGSDMHIYLCERQNELTDIINGGILKELMKV